MDFQSIIINNFRAASICRAAWLAHYDSRVYRDGFDLCSQINEYHLATVVDEFIGMGYDC